MNKKLLIVAGIVFALMFISVLSIIVLNLISKGKDSTEDTNTLFNNNAVYDLSNYDNKVVTGGEVLELIDYFYENQDTQLKVNDIGVMVPTKTSEICLIEVGTRGAFQKTSSTGLIEYNKGSDKLYAKANNSNTFNKNINSTYTDTYKNIIEKNTYIGQLYTEKNSKLQVLIFKQR